MQCQTCALAQLAGAVHWVAKLLHDPAQYDIMQGPKCTACASGQFGSSAAHTATLLKRVCAKVKVQGKCMSYQDALRLPTADAADSPSRAAASVFVGMFVVQEAT